MCSAPMTVVLATANPDKAAEIAGLLGDVVRLAPRPTEVGDVVEDAGSLVGNARLKAAAVAAATALPALADDTGFFVDALPDALGVEAASFGGPGLTYAERNALLLAALDGLSGDDRAARFETVALLRWPDGLELGCIGRVHGHIATSRRGTSGWGYDPIFAPAGYGGRTFAELGDAVKAATSHRARAFTCLAVMLGAGTGLWIQRAEPGVRAAAGAGAAAGERWLLTRGGTVVAELTLGERGHEQRSIAADVGAEGGARGGGGDDEIAALLDRLAVVRRHGGLRDAPAGDA